MNDPVVIRKKVREVLATVPNRRFSERMILDGVSSLVPDKVSADEFNTAMRWNEARGLIESFFNADLERDEWQLTGAGRVKEGL